MALDPISAGLNALGNIVGGGLGLAQTKRQGEIDKALAQSAADAAKYQADAAILSGIIGDSDSRNYVTIAVVVVSLIIIALIIYFILKS